MDQNQMNNFQSLEWYSNQFVVVPAFGHIPVATIPVFPSPQQMGNPFNPNTYLQSSFQLVPYYVGFNPFFGMIYATSSSIIPGSVIHFPYLQPIATQVNAFYEHINVIHNASAYYGISSYPVWGPGHMSFSHPNYLRFSYPTSTTQVQHGLGGGGLIPFGFHHFSGQANVNQHGGGELIPFGFHQYSGQVNVNQHGGSELLPFGFYHFSGQANVNQHGGGEIPFGFHQYSRQANVDQHGRSELLPFGFYHFSGQANVNQLSGGELIHFGFHQYSGQANVNQHGGSELISFGFYQYSGQANMNRQNVSGVGATIEEESETSNGMTGLTELQISECLMSMQYTKDKSNSDELCSICLDGYLVGAEAVKLKCYHEFHVDCLKQWMVKSDNCPLCRNSVLDV